MSRIQSGCVCVCGLPLALGIVRPRSFIKQLNISGNLFRISRGEFRLIKRYTFREDRIVALGPGLLILALINNNSKPYVIKNNICVSGSESLLFNDKYWQVYLSTLGQISFIFFRESYLQYTCTHTLPIIDT